MNRKKLAPDLLDLRYSDLVEIGISKLPELAPQWTDYNVHDPGIMLIEMLSWVSESQLYSLSRMRKKEREAFSALLGVSPFGVNPARGMVWPNYDDPSSPVVSKNKSIIVDTNTLVSETENSLSSFFPEKKLLIIPGFVSQLASLKTDDPSFSEDHTFSNSQRTVPFFPFGVRAGRQDYLSITFESNDSVDEFNSLRKKFDGALWPIGIHTETEEEECKNFSVGPPLTALMVSQHRRQELEIVSDSSMGMLKSGMIYLNFDPIKRLPRRFSIEFRTPCGIPRPPRVFRIQPNVIPVIQKQEVQDIHEDIKGWPDLEIRPQRQGLFFDQNQQPYKVEVILSSGKVETWNCCEQLEQSGPDDNVFELADFNTIIRFGNGINGRCPPKGSRILVTYAISDGEHGNVSRNRQWNVQGIHGVFGTNFQPMVEGSASSNLKDLKRLARKVPRDDRPIVTEEDLVEAALELPLLEVARAWVPKPVPTHPANKCVSLICMQKRFDGVGDRSAPPETYQWLDTIRRQLSKRFLMGTRLEVYPPTYKDFSIDVDVISEDGLSPARVKETVVAELKEQLALTAPDLKSFRTAGLPLSVADLAGWILSCEGVVGIRGVEIIDSEGVKRSVLNVPSDGLPNWNRGESRIKVSRENDRWGAL